MNRDSEFGIRDCGDEPVPGPGSRVSYLIQTRAQIPENDHWLSDEEKKVCGGFRVPKRRDDWLLGRWTAKRAVAAARYGSYGHSPSFPLLEIRAAQDGSPEAFFEGRSVPASISISHARDRAMCAVAAGGDAVGCDLEWVEAREANFAADYFTEEERALVPKAGAERDMVETLIWSAKETVLKILRRGLTRDTRSVVIRADLAGRRGAWNQWTGRCLESSSVFQGWWRAGDGFIYTIASSRIVSVPQLLR